MNKKRILVIGQHFWPESFRINDICDYLIDEKDCEIDVLCGIPNYPAGKYFERYSIFKKRKEIHNKINIRRVFEIPRGNNSNIRILINYLSYPLFSLFHIPYLLTKKYDKIFIYQLSPVMMSLVGIIIGKIKKIETIMYVLDLWPENLFSVLNINNKLLRKFVTKWSHWHYKKVDKLIALTDKMKNSLLDITKKDENKITVIPQTCEKLYEKYIYDEKLANKFKNSFNIVFTGNISPAQSFETILDAAELLIKDGLKDIEWIIVGDGMSKRQIEAQAIKRGMQDYFSFEGNHPIENIPKYTYVADMLVGCLSKSELLEATIPAKVVSYMASSKPIVLAMDGEVQALINSSKSGFASETEDYKKFADNIKRIYNMVPEDRAKMGDNGKKYYLDNFERSLILNRLYSFIFQE